MLAFYFVSFHSILFRVLAFCFIFIDQLQSIENLEKRVRDLFRENQRLKEMQQNTLLLKEKILRYENQQTKLQELEERLGSSDERIQEQHKENQLL
jgi:division protein CdvB (Snf7/Vps24/ESCRT-III family)